jgi:hypothetical protein
MELLSFTTEVVPEQVLVTGQENVASGLAIINPKKTYHALNHELWGQTLSNHVLIENFCPTMCGTPRQELNRGLAPGRACTQSTLPGLPRTGPGSSQGLASPSRSPSTSPSTSTQETGIILHKVGSNINIPNTANTSDMPSFANFVKASLPVETSSRKPKPMHIVKKRGIIPDGLVKTRLSPSDS